MDQDTEVVPTGQGSPSNPHQRGTGTRLNPKGGTLQAAPLGGRGNPDTITISKDHGQTPGRGLDCSDIADTMNGMGGSNSGDEDRTLEGMAKEDDQVKMPIHRALGKTDECDKVSIQRRTHTSVTSMDDDGTHF